MEPEGGEGEPVNFHEMGLDDRLLKAIASLGWALPTLIQEKAIPLALSGKDVLARARTGSGKTAAFAIPIIQKILTSKQLAKEQAVKALIITPSKELCNQASRNIAELISCCSREVHCVDVSAPVSVEAQRSLLAEKPDIVVGTPSRILAHVHAKSLDLRPSVEMVVVDEADLLFSYGYKDDMEALIGHLPAIYQAFLMSATLSEDVKALKKLVLHNPVILKLEESSLPAAHQLTQYHIKCEEEDKFVLLYTLLKLKLIRGKSIVFVNSVDRCYRLKLFLEQFGVPSCIINSELPVASRCHIVNQFNDGLYDTVIASDEKALEEQQAVPTARSSDGGNSKSRKPKKDKEYGTSRGIDFQFVSNVVNFDFPTSSQSYIHRVGRTARGDNQGAALSFVSMKEMPYLLEVEKELQEQGGNSSVFKPFNFRMEEIEGFRYRAKDAMRAVTRIAVKEARLKEIKKEMLTSQQLKTYFEDNPRDLQVLRHDKALHTTKVQPHLKNVPEYIVPPSLRHSRPSHHGSSKKAYHRAPSKSHVRSMKRKADPLKSFEFAGLSARSKKKK